MFDESKIGQSFAPFSRLCQAALNGQRQPDRGNATAPSFILPALF
jgi:hypothetical protein